MSAGGALGVDASWALMEEIESEGETARVNVWAGFNDLK